MVAYEPYKQTSGDRDDGGLNPGRPFDNARSSRSPEAEGGDLGMKSPDGNKNNAHLEDLQENINDTIRTMQHNVHQLADRGQHLDDLNRHTEQLQESSQQFNAGAKAVRKRMWFKDMRMTVILVITILIIIGIIVGAVVGTNKN